MGDCCRAKGRCKGEGILSHVDWKSITEHRLLVT